VQGQVAGHFGEIHPRLLQQFSFPEPVCAGELDCLLLAD
jgi:phenylalanyl-tRNA synthetase beta chain